MLEGTDALVRKFSFTLIPLFLGAKLSEYFCFHLASITYDVKRFIFPYCLIMLKNIQLFYLHNMWIMFIMLLRGRGIYPSLSPWWNSFSSKLWSQKDIISIVVLFDKISSGPVSPAPPFARQLARWIGSLNWPHVCLQAGKSQYEELNSPAQLRRSSSPNGLYRTDLRYLLVSTPKGWDPRKLIT